MSPLLQIDREYGIIYSAPTTAGGPPTDIAMMSVSNGWAKVREAGGEGEDAVRYVVYSLSPRPIS
jgi:hypothetical protein